MAKSIQPKKWDKFSTLNRAWWIGGRLLQLVGVGWLTYVWATCIFGLVALALFVPYEGGAYARNAERAEAAELAILAITVHTLPALLAIFTGIWHQRLSAEDHDSAEGLDADRRRLDRIRHQVNTNYRARVERAERANRILRRAAEIQAERDRQIVHEHRERQRQEADFWDNYYRDA